MKIEKNSKIVFMGDSITDGMRKKPIGEGLWDDDYGKCYVGLVRGMLSSGFPRQKIRVVNMGEGGNTVRDLKERWERDVWALEPDWVSIMIGVNDVWRQFDSPLFPEQHVYIEEFKSTLDELTEQSVKRLSGVLLMTPFFIEPRKDDPMRHMVDIYGAAVKETAKKYNTVLVDTQAVIDKITEDLPTAALAWDRVHPNMIGHMALAKAFVEAVS